MLAKNVQLGKVYAVKVHKTIAPVRLVSIHWNGGWNGHNCYTGRNVRIRTAGRLRYEMANRDGVWVNAETYRRHMAESGGLNA